MKTIRVKHPDGVDEMDGYLLEDISIDHEDFIRELKIGLENNKENIYLLQTFDKDEKDEWELIAFILAVNYPNTKRVHIYQVWRNTEKTQRALIDLYFHRVILWTENFSKTTLRMETSRDIEGFSKRWGFKPVSTIMEFDIPDDFEFVSFELNGKDKNNGTIQRNNGSPGIRERGGGNNITGSGISGTTANSQSTSGLLPKVPVRQSVTGGLQQPSGKTVQGDTDSNSIKT